MSYGLNVEMHKQVNVHSTCISNLPYSVVPVLLTDTLSSTVCYVHVCVGAGKYINAKQLILIFICTVAI